MASPANAPPSAEQQLLQAEVVTSSEIVVSVYTSLIGGFLFMALWIFFRKPLAYIFLKRTQLLDAIARPPPMPLAGLLNRCLSFLAPVFLVSDGELIQTAGLDALMLVRFLVLGFQIYLPVSALCCAVIIPLAMTGVVVDSAEYAATAEIMRYSLSNIEAGSGKLWACFVLSYVVLGYVCYCLYLHYKSYALLRLVHLRHSALLEAPGAPPHMLIVAAERRSGWQAVWQALLKLASPHYMLRSDKEYVKQFLEKCAAVEAAAATAAAATPSTLPAPAAAAAARGDGDGDGDGDATLKGRGTPSPPRQAEHCKADEADRTDVAGVDYRDTVVLPWWLPPSSVPAAYTAWAGSGVLHGKSCPVRRNLVPGTTLGGQPTWVAAQQYAVLFNIAGPPPSRALWGLLRPPPAPVPAAIHVDGPDGCKPGAADSKPGAADSKHLVVLDASGSPQAGNDVGGGAEHVAAQLSAVLQELFPSSFTHLVSVYNHKAVDQLLIRHEAASSHRDRCATAVAKARQQAAALGSDSSGTAAGDIGGNADKDGDISGDKSGGKSGGKGGAKGGRQARRQHRAAVALERAQQELRKAQEVVAELDVQVAEARQEVLQHPLGTSFIALFSDQTSAARAGASRASLLSNINFHSQPCPGPDNINWPALWTSWGQRIVRRLAVLPFLIILMVFPIGVLTGVLANLSTAVCGGTPETNSLYWPWYCNQNSLGARLLKGLLQGLIPSLVSLLWDTYVLPICFYFACQSEQCHLALSDLDRRILNLFFNFNVFNSFLGAVLGGALFQQIGSLLSDPGYWMQLVGTALPTASTYFLNYIIIHALSFNFVRFIWPHEGTVLFVIFRAVGLFRPKCERDEAMIRTAPSYRSARNYGSFLLIQTMALSYAVVAPLLLPAAAGFFLTAWITWRYCSLYFYERSYESGGRLFESLFTLMVWNSAVFTIFSALVLASKKAYPAAVIMLATQLPALMMYHRRVSLSVGHYASLLPIQATLSAPRAVINPLVYTPPPLRTQAVGWYPEWGKVWEKYGIARYSL